MDDDPVDRDRRARVRLDRIERRSAVASALRQGVDRANILRSLDVDAGTLDRLARALVQHPLEPDETAEELIVRAVVERVDRRVLVEALAGLEYEADPVTHRWEDVLDGLRHGWISRKELDEVQAIRSAMTLASRQGWTNPVHTAATIRQGVAEDDVVWIFRTIMQARSHLSQISQQAPDLAMAWRAAPALIDDQWDALLAAAIGHEFEDAEIEPPRWTAARRLNEDWVVNGGGYSEAEVRQLAPQWLAARRIFIAEHDLS